MMEPRRFFRFLADNYDFLAQLSLRTFWSETDIQALGAEHRPADLVQKGMLTYLVETQEYSLRPSVRHMFLEITQKRHLSSGTVTQIHVKKLQSILEALDRFVRIQEWFTFGVELESLQRALEQILDDVKGNLDAIRQQTSEFRSNPWGSARKRLEILGSIWDNQIQPLESVFAPHGPVDDVLEQIQTLLRRAETAGCGPVMEATLRSTYYKARSVTRNTRDYHMEAVREVRPLYEAAKRNEELARAASILIAGCFERLPEALPLYSPRKQGNSHVLDSLMGIETSGNDGEDRRFGPFSTGKSKTLLVESFFGYRYTPPPVLRAPNPGELPFVLTEKMVKRALLATIATEPVPDVMAWLIATFPKAQLKDVVRAYGWVVLKWGGRCDPAQDVVNRKDRMRITSHPVTFKSSNQRVLL